MSELQARMHLARNTAEDADATRPIVEKKIDGLVARIANQHARSEPEATNPPGGASSDQSNIGSCDYATPASPISQPEAVAVDEPRLSESTLRELENVHDFEAIIEEREHSPRNPSGDDAPGTRDSLSRVLLEHVDAEKLLDRYRPMAVSFPFVPIPPQMTVLDFSRRKPMTLLVIMAISSWNDRKQQAVLEKRYTMELAQRMLVKPHKTIDLLQSLLLYLAWDHCFINVPFQHSSTLHMAAGLTVDLKLDPRLIPHLLPGRNTAKRVRGGKDGQRALLGCYYLSSTSSHGIRAPNLFRASSYMLDSARRLAKEPEFDSDIAISSLTNIRYFEDSVFDILHPLGIESIPPSAEQVMLQLGIWQSSLAKLQTESLVHSKDHAVHFDYHGMVMELYHSVFRHLCRTSVAMQNVEILSCCLEAGRSFLNTLISVPIEEFHLVSVSVWLRLPCVMITMAMLTSPSPHHDPGWDVKAARDRLRLDLFMESLCFRAQNLTTFNPATQKRPDFWFALKTVLQSVGKWYKRTRDRETTIPTPLSSNVQTNFDNDVWTINKDICATQHPGNVTDQSRSNSTFATTPDSASSSMHMPLDMFAQQQTPFAGAMCPMMAMSANFNMDQFLENGFWGDGMGNFDTVNFDNPF